MCICSPQMFEIDNGEEGIPIVYLAQPDDEKDSAPKKATYTTGSLYNIL